MATLQLPAHLRVEDGDGVGVADGVGDEANVTLATARLPCCANVFPDP